MIQWFPGHMAKAKKEIEEKLKLVDIVFELVDARIPYSSRNPLIKEILKNKPRLVIMTKSELADIEKSKLWQNEFSKENVTSLLVDCQTGYNVSKIVSTAKIVLKDKILKDMNRGMKQRPIRAMVIGIPNVGKSTLINRLVGKNMAITGNKPGVTKAQQWIKISKDLDLLDTPGVLWPKFENKIVGYNLALTGAIKMEIIQKEDLIFYFLDFLRNNYFHNFEEKYNVSMQLTNIDILNNLGKQKNYFLNDDIDYERVYELLLNDFKNGRLGKITLDRLESNV